MRVPNHSSRFALVLATVLLTQTVATSATAAHRRVVRKPVIVVSKGQRAHQPRPHAKRMGLVDFNIQPRSTEVWVDGIYRGTADALDGFPAKLSLKAGKRQLKLVSPTGVVVKRKIKVIAGEELNIGLQLR